jgi:hypothetical protein
MAMPREEENHHAMKAEELESITIVSGLPRSGTSMMMRMLEAGGMPVLTDNRRKADEDNPQGYYEFEAVKQLTRNASWLTDAYGKAVKMASHRLYELPDGHRYHIVFMERNLTEVLASQRVMLQRHGIEDAEFDDVRMASDYRSHLRNLRAWFEDQANFAVIYVNYNEAITNPLNVTSTIDRFLGPGLDTGAMVQVVEPSLYRERA